MAEIDAVHCTHTQSERHYDDSYTLAETLTNMRALASKKHTHSQPRPHGEASRARTMALPGILKARPYTTSAVET